MPARHRPLWSMPFSDTFGPFFAQVLVHSYFLYRNTFCILSSIVLLARHDYTQSFK